jgi:hypothetical protein
MDEQDRGDESRSKWAGYSDYIDVASKLHDDINRAVDAYAHVDSKWAQGMGITPKTAIRTRQAILKITKRLFVEITRNNHIDEPFGKMFERWSGEEGYVRQLEQANFREEQPEWLGDLVDDIIAAGWELGYLKAGVEKPSAPEDPEQQAREMFK